MPNTTPKIVYVLHSRHIMLHVVLTWFSLPMCLSTSSKTAGLGKVLSDLQRFQRALFYSLRVFAVRWFCISLFKYENGEFKYGFDVQHDDDRIAFSKLYVCCGTPRKTHLLILLLILMRQIQIPRPVSSWLRCRAWAMHQCEGSSATGSTYWRRLDVPEGLKGKGPRAHGGRLRVGPR